MKIYMYQPRIHWWIQDHCQFTELYRTIMGNHQFLDKMYVNLLVQIFFCSHQVYTWFYDNGYVAKTFIHFCIESKHIGCLRQNSSMLLTRWAYDRYLWNRRYESDFYRWSPHVWLMGFVTPLWYVSSNIFEKNPKILNTILSPNVLKYVRIF